jgi:DNA anti-recombination protein RmuC
MKCSIMEQTRNHTATFDSVWALLEKNAQELRESRTEFDRRMAESDRRMAEYDRKAAESREEWERRWEKQSKSLDKLKEITNGNSENLGSFTEEYFFNSFEEGKQNFFGEKFDDIKKNIRNFWQGVEDE